MGIFSLSRPINEAEVDDGTNKPQATDDDDYTAGADTAADDESNDPTPDDNDNGGDDDVDYTDGADDAGDDEANDDQGDDQEGQEDQGDSDDDTVDYTAGSDDATSDESDDDGDAGVSDDEGSEDGDVDYTDGADGGGDDESDDTGTSDEEGEEGDEEGESQEDNTYEDLRKIEAELFSNLSPEQVDIKNKELKQRFIDVYGTIASVILRINDIPKTDNNVEILHFVTDKLMELKDLVDFNITKAFDTKTYIENSINYQICLTTLNNISDIIATVTETEDNPTDEKEEDEDGVIIGGSDSEVTPGDEIVAYGDKMIESATESRFNTYF